MSKEHLDCGIRRSEWHLRDDSNGQTYYYSSRLNRCFDRDYTEITLSPEGLIQYAKDENKEFIQEKTEVKYRPIIQSETVYEGLSAVGVEIFRTIPACPIEFESTLTSRDVELEVLPFPGVFLLHNVLSPSECQQVT
jgi:hypothetical protein